MRINVLLIRDVPCPLPNTNLQRGAYDMIKKTKLPGLVTAMCSVTLLLGACGKQSAPETHDSINIGASAALSTADNSQAMDNTSSDVMEQVSEGLYDFTVKGTLKEALATNMPKATNGGKTYTFNLRHDAKWSNGDPVTAQDFVYSWRRTVDPKTKSPQAYYFDGVKNYSEITARKKSPNTLGIQAVGKYKLVVTLDHAMPYFPSVLAVNASFPLNQKYVEKEGKKYGTDSSHTLYNGAYTLTNWNGSSDSWTYSKNKYYWDKKNVKIKTVNVTVMKSQTTAGLEFKSGKLDLTPISGDEVKNEKNNKSLFVRKIPGTMYLQYNTKQKLFSNEKIRQALTYATNSKELASDVLQDNSSTATGYVPTGFTNSKTGQDFAKQAGVIVKFDKTKAKQLWQEGLKELGMTKASFTLMSSDDDSTKKVDEYLQGQYEKALPNLTINIKAVPFNSRLSASESGYFDAVLGGWTPVYADPTDFLNLFVTGNSNNFGSYTNAQYDKDIHDANVTNAQNVSKRWSNLQDANKIVTKTAAMTPLYFLSENYLISSHLKGLMMGPLGQPYFKDVYWK